MSSTFLRVLFTASIWLTPIMADTQSSPPQQPFTSNTPSPYDPFSPTHNLSIFINSTLSDFHIPGLALAIVHGDQTFTHGYGHADLITHEPITPHTLFYAASSTKSFTAAITSHLVDSDEASFRDITWSTKLVDLIREDFVLQDEYATEHVSLVDALAHRTGLPRHDWVWMNNDFSARETVRGLRGLRMHREVREEWEYCNLMYTAVAHAIQTVTGRNLQDLLQGWIFKPLGMSESFTDIKAALAEAETKPDLNVARGYIYDKDRDVYQGYEWSDIVPFNAAGGIISNVVDYTKWIRLFLGQKTQAGDQPVSSTAIEMMTRPHMPVPDGWTPCEKKSAYYGLGLMSGIYRGHRFVAHGGSIAGYITTMMWAPELDWGVVVMTNAYALGHDVVAWKVADDFLNTPEHERADMAGWAREMEASARQRLRDARQRLYPDAPLQATKGPALPLQEYEGTYSHPQYGTLTLSMSARDTSEGIGLNQASGNMGGAPLSLYGSPSRHSFLDMSAVFHHVNGEYWWVLSEQKPGNWLGSETMRAKFDTGVNGQVQGLGLQVETALDDLAWFEKSE